MDLLKAVLLFLFCFLKSANGQKLALASVVFRHGDRSPIHGYPTDQYTESDWPQGYGQLSIVGMQQHELLGRLLRQRYVTDREFLNPNYTRVQVSVRSTDVDRTLMSGSTMLSMLFPPDPTQRFNDSLAWQPIPLHTVAKENDRLLRGYDTECPLYQQLREADKSTLEYQQKDRENQDFFRQLEGYTGLATVNIGNIWRVYDTVFIQNVTPGKEAPPWATPQVMARLNELADYSLTLMFNSQQKNKLTAGLWYQKVLGDINKKANGSSVDSKLFLYSAHDTTVACMLSAVGLYDGHQPPYATAFLIELYSQDSQYYVQFSLRLGPDSTDFNILSMPKCQNPQKCSIKEFQDIVQSFTPDDISVACGITTGSSIGAAFGLVTAALIVVIIILAVVMTIMYFRANKYRPSFRRDYLSSRKSNPILS